MCKLCIHTRVFGYIYTSFITSKSDSRKFPLSENETGKTESKTKGRWGKVYT